MRFTFCVLLLTTLITLSCTAPQGNLVEEPKANEGLVVSLAGTLEMRVRNSQPWKEISAGDLFKEGQTLRISEGEAYLQTGEGVIILLREGADFSFSYNKRSQTTTVIIHSGETHIYNPGINLAVTQPDLFLLSQGGSFSLKSRNGSREIYNSNGDLRILPGIEDPTLLAKFLDETLVHLSDGVVESQPPLLPGETWYLDENELRDRGDRYSDFILKLQTVEEQEEEEVEEELQGILSMNITISEYAQSDEKNIANGFELFSSSLGRVRYRVLLSTDEGAKIDLPHSQGEKSMEVVLAPAPPLLVSISKPGYQSLSKEITPSKSDEPVDAHYFKLPRLTSRRVTLNVVPPESEIRVNGIFAGKGSLALDLKPDEPLELNLALEGYNEKFLYLNSLNDLPDTIDVELKKTIEHTFKGAYQEVIGLAAEGEDIYLTDWGGVVWFIYEPTGWRRHQIRTNNYPNSYSPPVFTANYVYYSGKRSLVVMNRHSSAVLTVSGLNDRENHLKGQRVVPMDYQILLPTKDSIRFLTGDGSKIREVFIPGGSLMTPALYKGRIYTVATDGQVYEISSSGRILRSVETGAETPVGQSIVFEGNTGYFTDSQGSVVSFSPQKMSLIWKSDSLGARSYLWNNQVSSEKVFVYDGINLHYFDKFSGNYLGMIEESIETLPLLRGDYIYGATEGQKISVFSAAEGALIKEIELGTEVTTPIYPYDEKLMAGTYDGMVLILNQLDPSLLSRPIK